MKKISKKAAALMGMGALALAGGTFAYYNQTTTLDNPLSTGNYENELVEDYTPPADDLRPGATIDKTVGVKNTGDYPVMVRIAMSEQWKRGTAGEDGETKIENIIDHSSKQGDEFAAVAGQAENEFKAEQGGPEGEIDGKTQGDCSVVRKNLTSDSKWIFSEKDGYWYYNGLLYAGEETGNLLDSLTIASNIDLGLYEVKDWYAVGENTEKPSDMEETKWKEYKVVRDGDNIENIEINNVKIEDQNTDGLIDAIDMAIYLKKEGQMADGQKLFRKNESLLNEEKKGYADANYTLTVTSQFVQATPDALKEAFGKDGKIDHLPEKIQTVINSVDPGDTDVEGNGN